MTARPHRGAKPQQLERQVAARSSRGGADQGDRAAPPLGGDGSAGAAGNVGGYNNFWIDSGSQYHGRRRAKRASIMIDPPNGRSARGEAGGAAARCRAIARPTSDQSAREQRPGSRAAGAYDDPERRPLGERCLLGFGSTSGPPALPNYFYNNLHQIVQTKDT